MKTLLSRVLTSLRHARGGGLTRHAWIPAFAGMTLISLTAHAAEPARRAISLTPHITELIFAAGAGQYVVGTVASSDFPPAAAGIPRVGDGIELSAEKILALQPDLILAWRRGGAIAAMSPQLQRLGITLTTSDPKALADIPEELRRMGRLFGTQATAEPAADALQARVQALQARYAHKRTVRVFLEVGTNPLYTIGTDALLNDVLRLCGGVNVFGDSAMAAPQISAESVLVQQPGAVVTADTPPQRLTARRAYWSGLRLDAALRGHVYGIDPDRLYRPGPRLVDAAEQLCKDLDSAR